VRIAGDPAIYGNVTKIEGMSVIHDGNCFIIAAYYIQQHPDTGIFSQIADTFTFIGRP